MRENIVFEESQSLEEIEVQLKELWAQYVHCLDLYGLNETSRELKKRYLNLYESYKSFREWKSAIDGSA